MLNNERNQKATLFNRDSCELGGLKAGWLIEIVAILISCGSAPTHFGRRRVENNVPVRDFL